MSGASTKFDFVVIGAGPAGQKAAVQAAKSGCRVAVVEQERALGGACVHSGTIPSKTLREQAVRRYRSYALDDSMAPIPCGVGLARLLEGVERVSDAHDRYMSTQLARNSITCLHGRARFVAAHRLELRQVDGGVVDVAADRIVIATGSRPRRPDHVLVDHEHVLDSDSILSLAYLPRSIMVLGSGVIASEYASIFALLGCDVVQADRADRPLAFLDADLTQRYLREFAASGGVYRGGCAARAASWDGYSQVQVAFVDGSVAAAEKVLVALGRVANVEGLGLDAAGVDITERGHIRVGEDLQTTAHGVYAAGDVVGPPALASAAMEQGRRAACAALGRVAGAHSDGDLHDPRNRDGWSR
jgi:NAD(P) transhydrogenase